MKRERLLVYDEFFFSRAWRVFKFFARKRRRKQKPKNGRFFSRALSNNKNVNNQRQQIPSGVSSESGASERDEEEDTDAKNDSRRV